MDMIAYIPFVFLGAFLGVFTIINFTILYFVQKKDHKESARELQEYLHRWQIESDKNDKNAQRILDQNTKILNEIQKTNHDNSIFLRMIFERVDKPNL